MVYAKTELASLIVDIILIIYGAIFIFKAESISKSKSIKKNKRKSLKIWGVSFLIIGLILLAWIIFC